MGWFPTFRHVYIPNKFTYSQEDLLDPIVQSHLKKSDVTFVDNYQYAIQRLKFNKTDYEHTGVEIDLATPGPRSGLTHLYKSYLHAIHDHNCRHSFT